MEKVKVIDIYDKLLEFYEANLDSNLQFKDFKEFYWNRFKEIKFPSSKEEDYKYTDLKKIFENCILDKNYRIIDHSFELIKENNSHEISFQEFNNSNSRCNNKQENALEAIRLFSKYANNHFEILNNSFLTNPIFINIPDDEISNFSINNNIKENNIIFMPSIYFVVGKRSKVNIISKLSNVYSNSLANISINILAMEDSYVDYKIIQDHEGYQIDNCKAILNNNSKIDISTFTINGSLTRNNLTIIMDGENANANLNGLYYVKNDEHIDNNLNIRHLKPYCSSNQLYKGIVNDNGTGIFHGKIYVSQEAQKTNAFQLNKVLCTSPKAKVRTKPQLEIFADDVKCSHGATIGQLDEEQLLYLKSRGIKENDAKKMLLKAFLNDLLQSLNDNSLENIILKKLKVQY